MNTIIKQIAFFTLISFCFINCYGQEEQNKWKALFAIGLNSPAQDGFVTPYQSKNTNFPTINLGIQHMFKKQLGVKLDFAYNRFTNEDNTLDFKVNYTRINAQFVYNLAPILSFLPDELNLTLHAGPGYTMIKPLNIYRDNKTAYLNAMGGLEIHYSVSRTLSVFVDGSYIYGFSKDFNPIENGFGSFNGNLFTATIGVSVSLSGCMYCN